MPIERIPWTDDVEGFLDDQAGRACVPLLKQEVLRGRSMLWRCSDGPSLAYVITRMDSTPPELVIAYAQGRDMHKFAPFFIDNAHANGIPLRVHTGSPAMVKLLQRRWGLKLQEYVLRSEP